MLSVQEHIKNVKNKEIDIVGFISKFLKETKKINKEYNYLNLISEELALKQAENIQKNPKGRLAGLPVTIKDSICVKNIESKAGSQILEGYKPLFNATAVQNLINEGAIIIGKTSQDEFGFGSFNINVENSLIPKNPFDKERVTGGSSGGSAGFAQKISMPHISLGESTGGSIAEPSSFCGVTGLCPTYGLVSRYGLIDYANSLDKIGPIAKKPEEVSLALEVISGYDKKDSTSADKKFVYKKDLKKMKIGVIKEAFKVTDEKISNIIWKKIKHLESSGIKYKEVSLPLVMKYGIPAYYLIAASEASTNLAKYAGMRYGKHENLEGYYHEYFKKARTNFGKEAKRRVMIGTFARMSGFRDAFYIKALKMRTLFINEYKKSFKKFDLLVSPTAPILPPKFSEVDKLSLLQIYNVDNLVVGPNLAGLPHISLNAGFSEKLPVGMMFIGNHFNENKLINISSKI